MPLVYAKKGTHPHEINVSRYGPAPWNRLSPFHCYPARIPVPGTPASIDDYLQESEPEPEQLACSVEGIWQALKVLNGAVQPELLQGRPKKRRGIPQGHQLEYRLLSYAEAKAIIYLPSYLFVLRELEPDLVAALRHKDLAPEPVAIVDVSYQPDVLGPKPISHAALLTDYVKGRLQPYEAAHQSLQKIATRLLDAHADYDPDAQVSPVQDHLQAITQTVISLSDSCRQLNTYEQCATAWQRETLMLMAVRFLGCHLELEPGREMLQSWIDADVLDRSAIARLSTLAPVSRWNEDWFY